MRPCVALQHPPSNIQLLLEIGFALVLAACGSGGAGAPGADAPQATGTAPIAAGAIVISANNLQFDTDALSSPAGAVTIVFDNRDSGVPHNIHFHRGMKVTGESVGKTDVENGKTRQTLELDLDAGPYYYQCDVHPNMKGILTAS